MENCNVENVDTLGIAYAKWVINSMGPQMAPWGTPTPSVPITRRILDVIEKLVQN